MITLTDLIMTNVNLTKDGWTKPVLHQIDMALTSGPPNPTCDGSGVDGTGNSNAPACVS